MDAEGEEAFTMITEDILFPPQCVPIGPLNTTSHFQVKMEKEVLVGLTGGNHL